MAQTKPKAAQFYGVSGDGTAGQVLISDGNGGMFWGANTELFTISWNTPTGQGLTYSQPSPQSSEGTAGSAFPTTTFTVTKSDTIISGTATIAGLPTGITATQVITGSGIGNTLTVTLAGIFPGVNSLNTDLTLSGLTLSKTVSWATPTGQSLTYTQPSPQSSTGNPGTTFPTTTFTATKSGEIISGTATITGLPTGITATQSLSGSGVDNILTVTLAGVFPNVDSLNTNLTISGLTLEVPLIVDYLVVAGGGAGGYGYGGGGGAGGLRTSYTLPTGNSGGGVTAESSLSLAIATNYALTVGAGGAYASSDNVNPDTYKGVSSSFSTISTVGGGGGGNQYAYVNGGTGGSGGGGSMPGSTSVGGSGTTNQGYSGGTGYRYGAGGGGGAQQLGENGGTDGVNYGGNGGAGLAVNILNATNAGTASVGEVSGSDVYYAGGGGGLGWTNTIPATGGIGGGGTGVVIGGVVGSQDGVNNSGGGGGGGQYNSLNGGSGGSGVVILRYPSSYTVSGLTEATGSPFTEGSNKVSVFTSGTGNIQFN